MALLPKGGLNIGGHKIPWEAVGAVAAVVGVILVIRARQQGTNVASVGNAPGSAGFATNPYGNSFLPDNSGALANITEELAALQQSINQQSINAPAQSSPTPPSPWLKLPQGVGIPGFIEGEKMAGAGGWRHI